AIALVPTTPLIKHCPATGSLSNLPEAPPILAPTNYKRTFGCLKVLIESRFHQAEESISSGGRNDDLFIRSNHARTIGGCSPIGQIKIGRLFQENGAEIRWPRQL